jgi:hypothetical protein
VVTVTAALGVNVVQQVQPTVAYAHKVVKVAFHTVWIPGPHIAVLDQAISAELA